MTARDVAMIALICAGPVLAQDDADVPENAVGTVLEIPAHRALARLRADPDIVLALFETDGCSGGLSSVWRVVAGQFEEFAVAHGGVPPWEACCVSHDRLYHLAGPDPAPQASFDARLVADQELRSCVIAQGETRVSEIAEYYDTEPERVRKAYDSIAEAMFLAVRFGGGPCSGLPWRWGYGYPGCVVWPGDLRAQP